MDSSIGRRRARAQWRHSNGCAPRELIRSISRMQRASRAGQASPGGPDARDFDLDLWKKLNNEWGIMNSPLREKIYGQSEF